MENRGQGSQVLLVEDLSQQRLPARQMAAVLRRTGFSVSVVHFGAGSDPHAIVALAERERPRLIVFSILFAQLVAENLALAANLGAAGVAAHLTMVGPLATFAYVELLEACPSLDSVLCGEAEASVAHLAANPGDSSVPGLFRRAPALQRNLLPRPVGSLYSLPWPARDDGFPMWRGQGFATVEASQGCYHNCSFCLANAFYRAGSQRPYRLRSIADLADELEVLYQDGVRLFLFDDEQFLAQRHTRVERVQALGDALRRRGLEIAFTMKARPDDVDAAVFRLLKDMGLIRVYLGVESGCQATLDLLGKGTIVAEDVGALQVLDELGIVADFSNLLFHPWATLEMIQDEIRFLERALPFAATPFNFREVICYPGTALTERLRAEQRRQGAVGSGRGEWTAEYAIGDPHVELLRRLSRFVFSARDQAGSLHDLVVRAWYAVLLERRFRDRPAVMDLADALRASISHLNTQTLAVWREMLLFASGIGVFDAGCVNKSAAEWAERINLLDVVIAGELDALADSA